MSIWALAALCAAYWALKFAGSTSAAVTVATVAGPAPGSEPADLAKIFGPPLAAASAPVASIPKLIDPSTRFMLVGVVADRASAGVALISVEGKAARPYRVGSQIDDAYLLKSVALRSATLAPLSQDGAGFTLELARTAVSAPTIFPGLPSIAPPVPSAPPERTLRPPRTPESAV